MSGLQCRLIAFVLISTLASTVAHAQFFVLAGRCFGSRRRSELAPTTFAPGDCRLTCLPQFT